MVVADPKSEMFADTAELFKKHGYKVRVYNLLQPEYSDSWNCMFDLGGDTLMAQILTDVIISNTKGDEKGDHFWDNGESNLLKSLILYVDLDSTRTPEERNLAAVYQMLTQHTEKQLTMLFDRLPIGHPAKGPYSLFSQASDTVRAGIVLGLGTRLQVLQSEAVRRITRSSDIDLSEPGWNKCAYFIILDDQNSSLEFLSALFFAFLFIKLVRYADSTPEQRCKIPVNIILDEMNNIGSIKDFGRRLSTIRSRMLQILMCSQACLSFKTAIQITYGQNCWQRRHPDSAGRHRRCDSGVLLRPQRGYDGGGKLHYDHPAEPRPGAGHPAIPLHRGHRQTAGTDPGRGASTAKR